MMPMIQRSAAVGAILLGVPGAVAGLVLGLRANAPTAWAAVFEVGIPAAIFGGLLGLAAGAAMSRRRAG